jgi:DNA-binding XRE family transcriptional regulator
MKKTKKNHHNVKVAQNRGDAWKGNLLRGRLDASQNPSKIKLERIKQSFSTESMAVKFGLTKSTYCSIERGLRPVKKDRAELISGGLGKSLKHLFKLDKETSKYTARK